MKRLFLLKIILSLAFINCEKQSPVVQTQLQLQDSAMSNDVSGITVSKEQIDELPILFSYNGLYGYLDRQLQILVPPIYTRGFNYAANPTRGRPAANTSLLRNRR